MDQSNSTYLDILLPFYGNVEYLKETVISVISQDCSNWRLTIINDAHQDFSVDEWIEALNHKNIYYVRNSTNLGLPKNFSKAIDFATASHCLFLGSDDLLLPNYVSTIINLIRKNPGLVFIHPGVRVINSEGTSSYGLLDFTKYLLRRLNGKGYIKSNRTLATLMLGDWMYFPSIVWKVDKVRENGINTDYRVCLDLDLILNVLQNQGDKIILDEIIFAYRRHKQSSSHLDLLNGIRFKEEKKLYYNVSYQFLKQKNFLLCFLAILHLSSRTHAMLTLVKSLTSKKSLINNFKHIFT